MKPQDSQIQRVVAVSVVMDWRVEVRTLSDSPGPLENQMSNRFSPPRGRRPNGCAPCPREPGYDDAQRVTPPIPCKSCAAFERHRLDSAAPPRAGRVSTLTRSPADGKHPA